MPIAPAALASCLNDKVAVGLVTPNRPALEESSGPQARIEEEAGFHPREQLGISTQCGFESGTRAPLNAAQQQAKLTLVADVAASMWGRR